MSEEEGIRIEDAFKWWIVDYMETLALYSLSWGKLTAHQLEHMVEPERFGKELGNYLKGMVYVALLADELKKQGFYVHYLGYNHFHDVAQPDLIVAKGGKAAIIEVKGQRLNEDKASREAKDLLVRKKKYRGYCLAQIAVEGGLPIYLAYLSPEGEWRIRRADVEKSRSTTLEFFIKNF